MVSFIPEKAEEVLSVLLRLCWCGDEGERRSEMSERLRIFLFFVRRVPVPKGVPDSCDVK